MGCYFQCVLMITFLVMAMTATLACGQTPRVGFYGNSCKNVESIVKSVVKSHKDADETIAAGILRMHFHDCFMRGCDGSVLIAGNNTQRTAPPNLSLRGFEVIDDAKTRLEDDCPGIVSCADILAIAARDAVVLSGGRSWLVPLGRRDGTISLASDAADLPSPFDSVAVQKQKFDAKNLTTEDLVTLVGGHTLGTTSCGLIRGRFFNFNSTGKPDPSINTTFVREIQALCPLNGDPTRRVALDTGSPLKFDTSFFNNVKTGRGILQSDQVLWGEDDTRAIVGVYASLQQKFDVQFGESMIKMSLVGVKTGTQGQIRKVCSAVN